MGQSARSFCGKVAGIQTHGFALPPSVPKSGSYALQSKPLSHSPRQNEFLPGRGARRTCGTLVIGRRRAGAGPSNEN
jgi:hypothetical protein